MIRPLTAVSLLLLTLLPACKHRSTPPPPTPASSKAPRTSAPLDFQAVAMAIQPLAAAGDIAGIDAFVDYQALVDTSMDGVAVPAGSKAAFLKGVRAHGIGELIVNLTKGHGSYKLLRVYNQDAKTHAIFRLIQFNEGVTYHDWILARRPGGRIHIVDGYMAGSGEYLSQTFRRLVLGVAAAADNSLLSKLMGTDRAYVEHASDILQLAEDNRDGRYQDGLDIYNRLPASLQKEKFLMLFRMTAHQKLNHDADYDNDLVEYARLFPGDPSLDLLSMDPDVRAKNYTQFYACVDHLEKWTGGDPYLKAFRGIVMIDEGKPGAAAEAEKIAHAQIAAEPQLFMAHLLLVKSLSFQGSYAAAVEAIKDCQRQTHLTITAATAQKMNHLADSEPYKNFKSTAPTSP